MSSSERSRPVLSPARVDALGVALLGAAVVWVFVSAAVAGGSPIPVAAVLAASAAAVASGRATVRIATWLMPVIMAAAGAVLMLVPGALSSAPLQGPFGYANAAASFFALAAAGALMGAVTTRSGALRTAWLVAVAAFAAVPFVRGSLAPAVLLGLMPLAAIPARDPRSVRAVVAGCAALFVAALLATSVLGATSRGGSEHAGDGGVVGSALSGRRLVLWHDALVIMAEHPVVGVGPGRFAAESEVGRRDRDARWAHNEFLQQGAEEGVLGLVLLASLVLWGFARSWVAPAPDVVTALGAATLALVAIHACVDYVLHFPAIPVAAAALVGASQGLRSRRDRTRTESDGSELVGA